MTNVLIGRTQPLQSLISQSWNVSANISQKWVVEVKIVNWVSSSASVVIDNDKYQWLRNPNTNTWIDKNWVIISTPAIVSWTGDSGDYWITSATATADPWIDNIASNVAKWDTVYFDWTDWNSRVNNIAPHTHTANEITVTPTWNLTSVNVQQALEELQQEIDDVEWSDVDSFNGRTWAVTPQIGDYDADIVNYDNTTSWLSATTTQWAIDEVEARVEQNETDIWTLQTNSLDTTTDPYLEDVVAWTNITIDKTDPKNPVITASWWSVDEDFVIAMASSL